MAIRNMTPPEAHAALGASGGALVDVRTEQEFEQGHPEGAVNIPWALLDSASGRMVPNPDFVSTVKKHFPTDRPLYLSCQVGGRSAKACEELASAGFSDLVNVDGGYGGKRSIFGAELVRGWKDSGLPIADGPSDYDRLKG